MSFESFSTTLLTRFLSGFQTVNPTFDVDHIIFGRSQDTPPANDPYLSVLYADLEGNFEAIGKVVTQTGLLTVDIFVPLNSDPILREQLADNVHYVLKWLIVPDNGLKRNLGKRDFADSVGGYSHSRVSVRLIYDVKESA